MVGAVLAGVTTAPLWAAVAAGVLVTMGRPVLFRQQRVGRDGVPFTMLKFRSMRPAGPGCGPHAAADDVRHTRFGRLIRAASLDELPQLWNVIRGEMSMVGPRPEIVEVAEAYGLVHHPRHRVRPGVTGLWQVSEHRVGFVHEHVDIDETYVGCVTFRRDLSIVARTIPHIVLGACRSLGRFRDRKLAH